MWGRGLKSLAKRIVAVLWSVNTEYKPFILRQLLYIIFCHYLPSKSTRVMLSTIKEYSSNVWPLSLSKYPYPKIQNRCFKELTNFGENICHKAFVCLKSYFAEFHLKRTFSLVQFYPLCTICTVSEYYTHWCTIDWCTSASTQTSCVPSLQSAPQT